MKHTSKLMTSCLALALSAGMASAGSVTTPPPPLPPTPPVADTDWTGFYVGLHAGAGSTDDSFNVADTEVYGLQAGYLRDFGSIVGGAELQYSQINQTVWLTNLSTVRLRGILGYDAGRIMPYAAIGATSMISDLHGGAGMMYGGGLGAMFALNDSMRLGLEYYYEGNPTFSFPSGGAFDAKNQAVTLRIDYQF